MYSVNDATRKLIFGKGTKLIVESSKDKTKPLLLLLVFFA